MLVCQNKRVGSFGIELDHFIKTRFLVRPLNVDSEPKKINKNKNGQDTICKQHDSFSFKS